MDKLRKLFYDPKIGFVSMDKLYKKVIENDINVSKKDVQEFYNSQPINQVMRPPRKTKIYNTIYAHYPGEIYQMDIIIYDRYMYHNYKYILVVVDIYSRFAQAVAMTNRRMETIIEAYKKISKVMKCPRIIECDNEFNKHEFNDLMNDNNIEMIYSDPNQTNKNAIVERLNGTIARMLQKVRISLNRYDWYNYLVEIMYNYNHTVHGTTKNKPIDIWNEKEKNEQVIIKVEHSFNIGDKVRILRKKKTFDKGDEMGYSKDIYMVEGIKNGAIKLTEFKKLYKPYELKKAIDIDKTVEIHTNEKQTEFNNLQNYYKRMDIDTNNIITTKRKR